MSIKIIFFKFYFIKYLHFLMHKKLYPFFSPLDLFFKKYDVFFSCDSDIVILLKKVYYSFSEIIKTRIY